MNTTKRAFARKWIERFDKLSLEIEAAKRLPSACTVNTADFLISSKNSADMRTQRVAGVNKPDGDENDENYLLQVTAASLTLDTLLDFDHEVRETKFKAKDFKNRYDFTFPQAQLHQFTSRNPFIIADDLRQFVFAFCDGWQEVKNGGWDGLPINTKLMRDFTRILNPVLHKHRKMSNALVKLKKTRARKIKRSKMADREDDLDDAWV